MHPRSILVPIAAVALAVTAAGCGSDNGNSAGGTSPSASSSSAVVGSKADVAFAQLMIPHHEQALQMATMALGRTTSPEVQELARTIQAAQQPEIDRMKGWLAAWGAPEKMAGATGDDGSMDHGDMDMGGMEPDGMMSADDMMRLEGADGTGFDRMWLEMMISHHEGAIEMARQVLTSTRLPEVRDLAEAIVAGQTAEVAQMKALLAG